MANLNRVFLIGNLTRDPEVKYLPAGRAVADLNMAINRRYRTQAGEDKEETCFVGVVVWGRQAETCGEYLKKGSSIMVEGSLRYEQWETNGEKRSRLRVNADRVQFLDRLKRPVEPAAASAEQVQPAAPAAAAPEAPAASEEKEDDDNLPF